MYTEQIKYFMATLSKYQAERKKRSKMYKWLSVLKLKLHVHCTYSTCIQGQYRYSYY